MRSGPLRRAVATLYLGLAASFLGGCVGNENELKLPAQVTTPDLYLKGTEGDLYYILAESEEEGCTLAYSSPSGRNQNNTYIYSGRDCDNITLYARMDTRESIDKIVRKGKVQGEILEMANLTSGRISRDKLKAIYETYQERVEDIKDKHLRIPDM